MEKLKMQQDLLKMIYRIIIKRISKKEIYHFRKNAFKKDLYYYSNNHKYKQLFLEIDKNSKKFRYNNKYKKYGLAYFFILTSRSFHNHHKNLSRIQVLLPVKLSPY